MVWLCETGTATEKMSVGHGARCLDKSSRVCLLWWVKGSLTGQEARYTPAALKRIKRPPLERGDLRTSLVVPWLRIHLSIQGTQVQSLLWKDSTCCRADKPMHHNCRSPRTLGPELPSKGSHHNARTPQLERSPRALQLEKAHTQQGRPERPKIYFKLIN